MPGRGPAFHPPICADDIKNDAFPARGIALRERHHFPRICVQ